MKTIWHSALFRAMIGAAVGALIGLAVCRWVGIPIPATVLSSGLYGALTLGATVLYGIESWNITQATVCHLLITLSGFCALGSIQRWLSRVPIWGFAAFFVTYFIVWIIQWAICFQHVRAMNAELRRLHCARARRDSADKTGGP